MKIRMRGDEVCDIQWDMNRGGRWRLCLSMRYDQSCKLIMFVIVFANKLVEGLIFISINLVDSLPPLPASLGNLSINQVKEDNAF